MSALSIDRHDQQAEEAALAAAIQNESACDYVVAHLDEDDFWSPDKRTVFRSMAKLRASGEPVDAVTMKSAMRGNGAKPEDVRRLCDLIGHLDDTLVVATNIKAYVAAILDPASTADESEAAEDGPCLDWSTFWDTDQDESEWLCPDVLAKGRSTAIYSKHGVGKSLFLLYIAAEMATGPEAIMVVYCDYEMTLADVRERLADMGYGPETDLSRLRYYLLPTLPPLDTANGAEEFMRFVDAEQAKFPDHHLFVAFDTISRAVAGPEDDADTYRDFYNHTGIKLKSRGATVVRNDHAGKDPTREQRGSSSKGDDVDVVWLLERVGSSVVLTSKKRRMPWVPARVVFEMTEEPLAYRRAAHDYPPRTAEIANLLNRLEVPLDASGEKALAALRAVEKGCTKGLVLVALQWRREHRGES